MGKFKGVKTMCDKRNREPEVSKQVEHLGKILALNLTAFYTRYWELPLPEDLRNDMIKEGVNPWPELRKRQTLCERLRGFIGRLKGA